MLSGPTAFYTVLTTVRDANMSALRDAGNAPPRSGIVPGAIAWDECDQCGLLALASVRMFLSDTFPIETTTTTVDVGASQGALLCSDMASQIIRCAPEPQSGDIAPSTAALEASASLVNADAYAVLCSTVDALTKMVSVGDIADFMVRQQVFVGPAGSCVGSELSFAVAVIR